MPTINIVVNTTLFLMAKKEKKNKIKKQIQALHLLKLVQVLWNILLKIEIHHINFLCCSSHESRIPSTLFFLFFQQILRCMVNFLINLILPYVLLFKKIVINGWR